MDLRVSLAWDADMTDVDLHVLEPTREHAFSGQQTLIGPATMIATVYTNWGRADEKREVLTLRLDSPKDLEQVGVVTIRGRRRVD